MSTSVKNSDDNFLSVEQKLIIANNFLLAVKTQNYELLRAQTE